MTHRTAPALPSYADCCTEGIGIDVRSHSRYNDKDREGADTKQ